MANPVTESGAYLNLTATDTLSITNSTVKMTGVFCSTSSSGTLTITDQDGAAVTGTISLVAGQFYVLPFQAQGFTYTIAGTANITVAYTA